MVAPSQGTESPEPLSANGSQNNSETEAGLEQQAHLDDVAAGGPKKKKKKRKTPAQKRASQAAALAAAQAASPAPPPTLKISRNKHMKVGMRSQSCPRSQS